MLVVATAFHVEPALAQRGHARDLGSVSPSEVGVSADRLQRLDAGLQALVDDGKVAGIVTMLARHGKVVFTDSAGKLDINKPDPAELDSVFQIFSMTKPVVGVAMMMLHEEGKWQLHDPVSNYIPAFAELKVYAGQDADGKMRLDDIEPGRPVTMRDLMMHTAGLGYVFGQGHPVNRAVVENGVLDPDAPLQTMIDKLVQIPLLTQPGDQWAYSISVDVQGYLVEQMSGQFLGEFLEERILGPLGMVDTAFYVPPGKMRRLAVQHHFGPDGALAVSEGINLTPTSPPNGASGGSGLYGTAPDYLRFAQMLLNGGELNGVRLLSPRSVELMSRDHLTERERATHLFPGEGFGLDFSVVIDDAASGQSWSAGSYYWFGAAGTWFWIDPVEDLVFVGMIQIPLGTYGEIHQLSRSLVYQSVVAD
jgi:CubicO group peptidase (beta-lactamase class C family)